MSLDAVAPERGLPGLEYPERYIRELVDALSARFTGTFGRETVERYVLESYTALLRSASVRAHLALHVERFATERLVALAQAEGTLAHDMPEVLFVCEQNAGRSQMAAVLTNHLAGGRVHVRSAGSMPTTALNPVMVEAMRELGLNLDEAFPKPLTDDVVRAADVVVTMGCGDACPVYAGKRYEDWILDDPDGAGLEQVRRIRDAVAERVSALLASLAITGTDQPGS